MIEAPHALPRSSFPADFEIPDDCWIQAGMQGFRPLGRAYCACAAATPIPLREIEPPFRLPEYPLDRGGFDRARLISLLSGIAAGADIQPVPVIELVRCEFPPAPFRYRVRDGMHRFYASVAAGFECLPVLIS